MLSTPDGDNADQVVSVKLYKPAAANEEALIAESQNIVTSTLPHAADTDAPL